MFVWITGGSASGKSEFAERLLVQLSEGRGPLFYVATMQPYGAEARARIVKHQRQRACRGFCTAEQYTEIGQARVPYGADALVECLSNLTANEMFGGNEKLREEEVCEKVTGGILRLRGQCRNLAVVSNEIFSDGICYGEDTKSYMRCLAAANRRLAAQADAVIEVVYTVPVFHWKSRAWENLKLHGFWRDLPQNRQKRKGKNVDFIIGGCYQGKTAYAKKQYQLRDADIISGADVELFSDLSGVKCLNGLHLLVRRTSGQDVSPEQIADWLFAENGPEVILSDEIGYGVVPVDASERRYREAAGRLSCRVAERAERVVRVVCGYGQVLKG